VLGEASEHRFKTEATFDHITYWHHDGIPSMDTEQMRALRWMQVADVVSVIAPTLDSAHLSMHKQINKIPCTSKRECTNKKGTLSIIAEHSNSFLNLSNPMTVFFLPFPFFSNFSFMVMWKSTQQSAMIMINRDCNKTKV
jgi:hypothetical protein